ncbi:MAG: aminotransferase class V-fold PLP-dependent enzyme [Elusimicrobiota bacterium]
MIYLDNAATSYPKPPVVSRDIKTYLDEYGVSSGRSAYPAAVKTSKILFNCREALARFFNIPHSSRVVFTLNATYGINTALKGFLNKDDEVLTSSVEHNAVMRPLNFLKKTKNIKIKKVKCDSRGYLNLDDFKKKLDPNNVKLVVINHASNVTGAVQNIKPIGKICRAKKIPFMVDAAQTAGSLPIDVAGDHIDIMAFSGHKSLMGPTGVGALYVKKGLEFPPLCQGGTGSKSEKEIQPDFWPDKMESGTLNICPIVGLNAALKYFDKKGFSNLLHKKKKITGYLLDSLKNLSNVTVHGPKENKNRTAAVSVTIKDIMPSKVSRKLSSKNICVRVGLHCAPGAHKTIGTLPQGTVRITPGYFSKKSHIDKLIRVLENIT